MGVLLEGDLGACRVREHPHGRSAAHLSVWALRLQSQTFKREIRVNTALWLQATSSDLSQVILDLLRSILCTGGNHSKCWLE